MLPASGLRTHRWNTAIRSMLLLAGFPVLLALMGYAAALLLVSWRVASVQDGLVAAFGLLPTIIPAALALACAWFAIAWLSYHKLLDLVTGAQRVTDPREEPRLWKLTEELCISRGMPMPRLGVIDTPARNAFASGLSEKQGAVTVTRGLMEALDDRELSAVLAHELAHIRNGDARLGVIAAVFVGVITLVTDAVWNVLRFGRFRVGSGHRSSSSSRNSGGGATVVIILIAIAIAALAHGLALVLRMALSRNREYLADASAVDMTKDADAMISALRKVEQRSALPRVPEQVRAMFLHDAALSAAAGWFATHPPIDRRVAALVQYGGGHDPGPLPAIEEPAAPEGEEAATPVSDAATASASADAPGGAQSGPQSGPWGAVPAVMPGARPWATPVPGQPRSAAQERRDAMAAFARTNNAIYMDHLAKREAARRAGLDPDAAAPPAPPR